MESSQIIPNSNIDMGYIRIDPSRMYFMAESETTTTAGPVVTTAGSLRLFELRGVALVLDLQGAMVRLFETRARDARGAVEAPSYTRHCAVSQPCDVALHFIAQRDDSDARLSTTGEVPE